MRANFIFGLIIVIAASLAVITATGGATASPTQAAPVFEEASCDGLVTYRPEDADINRVRCGYVAVPENRSKTSGPKIRIAVAVIKAKGAAPSEPLVFLTGGPGQGAVDGALYWGGEAISGPVQLDHDIVFFDPRGTGYSGALRCPENEVVLPEDLELGRSPTESRDHAITLLKTCGQLYRDQGIDLSQYTSSAVNLDAIDLMHALGYEKWSLIGVSYGTRYALTMMRDDPQYLRSVILDSTVPIERNNDLDVPRNFQDALANLFAACRADSACATAYPRLEQEYWEGITRANASPVEVTIQVNESPVTLSLSGSTLLSGTFLAMYDQTLIPVLPFAIHDIASGNTGVLTVLAQQLTDLSFGIADIMSWAVNCNEEFPFYTPLALAQSTRGVRAEIIKAHLGGSATPDDIEAEHGLCTALGTHPAGSIENRAVKSAVPALILAGAFDYVTPASDASRVHANLSKSHLVVLPATTHAVTFWQQQCTGPMMAAFLAAPATAPNSSCVGGVESYKFVLPAPPPAPAPASSPSPTPVAGPSGVITGPDTGTGFASRTGRAPEMLVAMLLMAGGTLIACGGAMSMVRRRTRR